MDPRELLSALSLPSAFPEAGPDVRVIQTHISMIFLTGERVYKVKKPVHFWGLVDYRTLERRRFYCEEEVRIDRRFAPEIYLGVLPVVRDAGGRIRVGGAVANAEILDYAVVMRRFPDGATLEDRIHDGTAAPADVETIARALATLHTATSGNATVAFEGRPDVFERVLEANLKGTEAAVPALYPAPLHRAFADRLRRRLADARTTLDRRVEERRLVDGHGDLRAEHAVWLPAGFGGGGGAWRLIDAIEFSTILRCIDPLADVAFLAMDLAFQGRRDLSHVLLDAYLGARPDADAAELLPIYLSQRAHVRMAVDARVAVDATVGEAARARAQRSATRHLLQATAYAHAGDRPTLVLVAGPSGVGKSAVTRTLAPILDADVFASDVVRKELAGIAPTTRVIGAACDALYAPSMSARTYAELEARAGRVLAGRGASILDATFLRRDQRARVYALARAHAARIVLLWGSASLELVRERIAARAAEGADPSDATLDIHRAQLAEMDAPDDATEWVPIVRFDAKDDVAAVLLPVAAALWGDPTVV